MDTTMFKIPVYVINLKERSERRRHIEEQFEGKSEFDVHVIEAVRHPIGAVGLWQNMVKAVEAAVGNNHDVIIICEDDHIFTKAYNKEYLFTNMIEADKQNCELLSGGIGGFGLAVPVSQNRFWIDWFWCTQFIVVFKPLFHKILDYDFNKRDTADGVLSHLVNNKMTMFPFISVQKDFGYSDITLGNNVNPGIITKYFQSANARLELFNNIYDQFHPKETNGGCLEM